MTSGVALESSRRGPQNPRETSAQNTECFWNSTHHDNANRHPRLGQETKKTVLKKKRPPTPIATPVFKKSRASVQRTHSPKTLPSPLSSPKRNSQVQKITPSVMGIKEVVRHLLKSQSSNTKSNAILALPTECTYEVCSLVSWSKKEALNEADASFRRDQVNKLKQASSSPCVHIYLQHQNIQQMDRFLEFPKKQFATKQNPEVCSAFNETRVLFQRLADQFWPGPVHLYLPPQSFAPDGLIRKAFNNREFVGFRCPSHPLTVKVLKQVHNDAEDCVALIGSPVHNVDTKLLNANDVACKFAQSYTPPESMIQILQGEERREIFSVPTCQFGEEWLECWIVPEKRVIVLRGKTKRDVLPQIKQMLRSANTKDRVLRSVLLHWKILDQREK